MSVEYQKRFFNVGEYYRMAEAGVLGPNDHVELIEGEIIEMSPIGGPHAACVRKVGARLTRLIGDSALLSIQSPVAINGYSEPQPDVAILKPRDDFYSQAHPTPDDVLLIIEVADTSVDYDRNVKMPLYARAGIPEAWLVNLPRGVVEVYTQPADGTYQRCQIFKRGQTIVSEMVAGLTINVEDILV
jgi:Uma2 family endonuclease